MLLDSTVISVVRELRDAFDEWKIALWFVTPNASTNGVAPVDAFESNPLAALAASQTDRFLALGLERSEMSKQPGELRGSDSEHCALASSS
jgi:hypothetical protein